MSVWYSLVNYTKRERISFLRIPAASKYELAHHPAAAAITTWYLLENRGDNISFISDTNEEWPFPEGSWEDHWSYREVTDKAIDSLLANGILSDYGKVVFDEDDPDNYIRDLRSTYPYSDRL